MCPELWQMLPLPQSESEITVNQVLLAYLRHAKGYYVKDGKITNEVTQIKQAIEHVKALYGSAYAESFGPLALECVRDRMVDVGWSRKHVNKQVGRRQPHRANGRKRPVHQHGPKRKAVR
jgi:hypothetical protein